MPLDLTSFSIVPVPAIALAPPALGLGPVSPLVVADRLIGLAKELDRAGFLDVASGLIDLMFTVLDGQAASA